MKKTEKTKETKDESYKSKGRPLSEKEYKEWENAFIEIENISKKLKNIKVQ